MKTNNYEQDSEQIPIKFSDNSDNNTNNNNYDINSLKKDKKKYFSKNCLMIFFIVILIFSMIYLVNNNHSIIELNSRLNELQFKIEKMNKQSVKKKIGVAFVNQNLYGSGIARLITVLSELLIKTGKFEVYLINQESTVYDFKYYKKIKREIQKKTLENMKNFDEANDIQIYILNNDVSDSIEIYKSFGKKVIGIFHGVYLSCIFSNETYAYRIWNGFSRYDSFVHIIPDDFYIYKKLGFNNTIYIPNVYTFESQNTPSSPLTSKNILMVGRVNDIIKGAKYGFLAMAEIIKEVPDAILVIVSPSIPQDLVNLSKQLKIEKNVKWVGYIKDVSKFYLDASVLLVTSVTESFPMVMNEGKAHGLPIVSFNINYSPCFQSGVITVEMFNHTLMAKETIKLLKDENYRKKKGQEAKLSLDYYNNNETIAMWEKLFYSLIKGGDEYNKFQEEVKKKYYNEELAKEHLEKHFKYAQKFNNFFSCHSFENFTTLSYINKIEPCPKK